MPSVFASVFSACTLPECVASPPTRLASVQRREATISVVISSLSEIAARRACNAD